MIMITKQQLEQIFAHYRWKDYKMSVIEYCMFTNADFQLISYDLEEYPFVNQENDKVVMDITVFYSNN